MQTSSNRIRTARAALVLSSCALATAAALAQSSAISLVAAAAPPVGELERGSVVMLEYERLVSPAWSVFGRVSRLSYRWDDGFYVEEGDGNGFGLGMRWYPRQAMEGFYVGGALSLFKSDWDWREGARRGSGDTRSVQWGAEAGYRFKLGAKVSVTPAINVGSWLGSDGSCKNANGSACTKESELGFYSAISLSLSVLF